MRPAVLARLGLVIAALMIAAFVAGWTLSYGYLPAACSSQEDGTIELCGDDSQYDYRDPDHDGRGQWYHR